jgi:RNA polymerase sigma-70 factor (family 1)
MKRLPVLTDDELFALLKQGHEAAFDELYSRYWAALLSAAWKRTGSREAAEEIVQDFFTQLWMRRESLEIHTNPAVYLFTAIKYKVLNYHMKEEVRRRYRNNLQADTQTDHSVEDAVIARDLALRLEKEVQHLPLKCRAVFDLSRKQHKSHKEIAEILHISEKTVENHLTKALRLLRTNFREITTGMFIILFLR